MKIKIILFYLLKRIYLLSFLLFFILNSLFAQHILDIPSFVEKPERIPQFPLKSQRMLYTQKDVMLAKYNIQTFEKAKRIEESIRKEADKWLAFGDTELRDLLSDARVPRAFDLNTKGCPEHGEKIFKKGGFYPWVIDAKQPFKVKCPIGGEIYPSNDYESYYKSGFKEKNGWDTKYVDDGWGWVAPDGKRYWFVAYANHWLWRSHINTGILNLARAYLLTEDKRYAHKAAVMIYRLAQVYPEMDYTNQSRYGLRMRDEGKTYDGKVVNAIWETAFIRNIAEAYDLIWDSIDENIALQELYDKNGKELRSFIEANLLEEAVDAYVEKKIRGNLGMHQEALMYILLSRERMDTKKYIDQLMNMSSHIQSYVGLKYSFYNQVFRDGQALESPGYNLIWVDKLASLSELFRKGGLDLYNIPKLKMLFDSPLKITSIGNYSVDLGDSGSVLGKVLGRNPNTYQIAYDAYKDDSYLSWLASSNQVGENSFVSFESLFREPLSKKEALKKGRAVDEQPSRLLAGYGLGILNNKKDEVGVAFTYGMHISHYHWDFLNFELFANEQKMMPDLGYPDAMNVFVPERFGWSTNTINHNTVVVDEKRQDQNQVGVLHDFSDGKFARVMDASSAAYTNVSQYRRKLIMVDVNDNESYIVDFFSVKGGKQHDYSLHGPPGTVSTQDGIWGDKQKGTFAGTDIEIGQMYDDEKLGAKDYKGSYASYTGSGFQYLFNVQQLRSGKGLIEYSHVRDKDARLRIHSLTKSVDGVYMADAYDKPRAKTHLLKYLIVQRKARDNEEELKSDFVSVLEPYHAISYIKSSQLLTLKVGSGNAVEVLREDEKDIIISDTTGSVKKIENYPVETDANSVMFTVDYSGKLKRVFFSDGTYLVYNGQRFEASSITGIVTAVDVQTRKISVKVDNQIKNLNEGQSYVSHFSNNHKSLVHPVLKIEKKRGLINVIVEDDLLVGLLRVEGSGEGTTLTKTALPFSPLYNGVSVLDSNQNAIGMVKKVSKGELFYSKEPMNTPQKGDDLWLCTVGVGDYMKIKSVFTWQLNER